MTAERQAEYRAHETLRDAIRQTSVANWDRHTVMAVLRTDGECAQHRTVGLLHTALAEM